MIRYLANEEKSQTRAIWEEIFKDDAKPFLDYYYNKKTENNKILVKHIDRDIVAMLHLNPYNIIINKNKHRSYYFVAVATLENHRKKGYMKELIYKSLKDMYSEKVPFTFLRPAKEEIYLPFDFRYIYNHEYLDFDEIKFVLDRAEKDDLPMLAKFTNDFLNGKYNVYCERNEEYMKKILAEVHSEQGDIVKIFRKNKFIGYYIYWGLDKTKRAIFIDEKYVSINKTSPLVMGRIVNVYSFFENNFTSNEKIELRIKIIDNIIKENNGIFSIKFDRIASKISKKDDDADFEMELNISDVTSLFFGYTKILDYTDDKKVIKKFDKITLLNKIFIDEEV